jgi:hypothetical protein
LEHAQAFEPIQEGRIYIEEINAPFLYVDKATPAEYAAGLDCAVSLGWLELHESGTFVKLTQSAARTSLRSKRNGIDSRDASRLYSRSWLGPSELEATGWGGDGRSYRRVMTRARLISTQATDIC